MNKQALINDLNLLLTRNHHALIGYKKASQKVGEEELRLFFHQQVRLRKTFEQELKEEIRKLGGQIVKHMSLSNAFQFQWMDLKGFLGATDRKVLLIEVIKGEQEALEDYEEVLSHQAIQNHPRVKDFIVEERGLLLKALDRLRQLATSPEYTRE